MTTLTISPYQAMQARRKNGTGVTGRTARFTPEVRHARLSEAASRNGVARRRALMVLADRHRGEYDALVRTERQALDAERGPLPGDPA